MFFFHSPLLNFSPQTAMKECKESTYCSKLLVLEHVVSYLTIACCINRTCTLDWLFIISFVDHEISALKDQEYWPQMIAYSKFASSFQNFFTRGSGPPYIIFRVQLRHVTYICLSIKGQKLLHARLKSPG